MSLFLRVLVLSCGLVSVLSGCNGGGTSVAGGALCPAVAPAYDPMPIKVGPNQKAVNMSAKDASNKANNLMLPGKYTYTRADIFFVEKNNPAPINLQLYDVASGGASTKQGVTCMENARLKMNGINVETQGATDIVVCSDQSQEVSTRTFQFDITNGQIHFPIPQVNQNNKLGSPGEAYDKKPFLVDKIMLWNNANDYEVRSKYEALTGTYYLDVHMAYTICLDSGCSPTSCKLGPAKP